MLTRAEAVQEAKKARNLCERMAKEMQEMGAFVDAAEAKLKVMEAWVCAILKKKKLKIKKSEITEALMKKRLNASFEGDNLILFVEDRPEEPIPEEKVYQGNLN